MPFSSTNLMRMNEQPTGQDLTVGRDLRRRRKELGITLRELADKAGLSSGFLSQVENDRVSPSLKSLGRIAEVLRVPLFSLLSNPASDPVVRAGNRKIVRWPGGGEVDIELLTPFRDWQLLPFHRTMEAGESSAAVKLEHAREEWIFVQTGEVEIELTPDEHHVLSVGDAIHFESSRLISITNSGATVAEYICMMTPPAI